MNHRPNKYRALSILPLLFLFITSCTSMQTSPSSQAMPGSAPTETPIQAIPESAPAETPILKLDTGGHMALIRDIVAMKDGRRIISASDDKTIRIWDTETGQETAKILGQIGWGDEGKILTIALTPDERWLAVGGFNGTDGIVIRIYDVRTGTLIKVLKSYDDLIYGLSLSKDGRYLVSGGSDRTVKEWDIADNFNLLHIFKGHTKCV